MNNTANQELRLKPYAPWEPPFIYDDVGIWITDQRGNRILDMRGWGFLTGKGGGGLGLDESEAVQIQDRIVKHIVDLMNRDASHPTPDREVMRKALEALQTLRDEQNGPPLERHKAKWERAMTMAEAAITALEEVLRGGVADEPNVEWSISHPETLTPVKIDSFEEGMEKWFEGFNPPKKITNGKAESFEESHARVKGYYAEKKDPTP